MWWPEKSLNVRLMIFLHWISNLDIYYWIAGRDKSRVFQSIFRHDSAFSWPNVMSAAVCKSGHVRLRRSDLRTPSQSSDSSKCYTNPARLSLVNGDIPCLWLVNIKTISFTIPESVKDTKGTRVWLLQLSRERSNLGGKMLGKCKYQGRCSIDIGPTEQQAGHHLYCHFRIFWRGLKTCADDDGSDVHDAPSETEWSSVYC